MALELIIVQQPHEVSFSGNPLPFTFALVPYGVQEHRMDIRIQIRVEMEVGSGFSLFNEVYSKVVFPTVQGTAQVDISSIVDAYLEQYMPRPNLIKAIAANGQFKKCRIIVLATQDGNLVGDPITSNVINLIKGGLAYEQWNYRDFFEQTVVKAKKPLHFFTEKEYFHQTDVRYLFWTYPLADEKDQKVLVEINYANGVVFADEVTGTVRAQLWAVFLCPMGLNQLRSMFFADPPDLTPVSYTVTVVNEDDVIIVAPITTFIEQRNYYDSTQLLYSNSVGGIDTAPILGEIDASADYTSSLAQQIPPPSGIKNALLVAQVVSVINEETEKFIGNTNFISKDKVNRLRDLLLSRKVYEIKNGRFFPVNVNKKTAKFYTNKDRLVGMAIEWQNAWSNNFYTPEGIIPAYSTCPALLTFRVVQLTRDTLQIIWAMPMPFDILEVQIDNGTPGELSTTTLTGNTGSASVGFVNNAVDPATMHLTVKGRVICNNELVVPDAGPYSTVDLDVNANSLPIANDDVFYISAGYTTAIALNGNVLDNDYDPDNDPLEAIPATGATTAGGSYQIFADGTVEYMPPSALYNGTDSFTYQVQEAAGGTPVTATVRVNVGDIGLGDSIYIKMTERNHVANLNDQGVEIYAEGDFYLTFWADAQATIPKDLTGLGINITWRLTVEYRDTPNFPPSSSTNTDTTVVGTGTEMYLGHYVLIQRYVLIYRVRILSVRPGTGYVPI